MSRSPWEVSDELWALVEPLLPKPERVFGRPRLSDRAALEGILFVLVTGVPWKALPRQLGYGSGAGDPRPAPRDGRDRHEDA